MLGSPRRYGLIALDPGLTLAGLIHANVGRPPREGDRIEIGPIALTMLDPTETRLRRIRLEWSERTG
ncbi:hypothetical protein DM868_10530 [Natronomonas salsuginis]|uniref:Uncharacterized protein n=1 Tax=Natronomonas salsuginis TaxID=2217661 RepID=A0A4U5J8K6_9EURY|nr:hypothetical protein DM868_10530 [Natronomonas salsuginis]